ncbi:S41 family peptidase [Chryseobacterium sp. HMWF035]|uniref:S41 family peptidase n=3 Tax=unclassified Chryseobacterium TaxID=2593645 RepID=UPI000D56CB69|nr:S41 family peptidase [Chryseobacterium sp. HMWF035]PVV50519.1 hypothetical protein DD829_22060 [Chryseobacterium sp. HMWF035]
MNKPATLYHFYCRYIGLFCFLIFSMHIPAQKYSKKDVLNDLKYFEIVIESHPLYNDHLDNSKISEIISAEQRNIQEDSISYFQYKVILGKIFYALGCVHTGVTKPAFVAKNIIPITIINNDEGFFITDSENKKLIGEKIIEINKIPIEDVFNDLNKMVGSDGGGNSFGKYYFIKNSPFLLAEYFINDSTVSIQTEKEMVTISKIPAPQKNKMVSHITRNTSSILFQNNNYFYMAGDIGVLKISSFEQSSKKFFKQVFTFLKKNNTEKLIIDLRGNLGGNIRSAMFLCQNLVSQSFQYDIDYDKSNIFKYLNMKGKLYFNLSKVKYTLENIFTTKKLNSKVRSYNYHYQSLKENNIRDIKIIVDEGTASSSTMCITILEKQFENIKIIGTRPAGGYNGNNGGAFPTITLPETKIEIRIPLYRIVLDRNSSQREGIVPDVKLEPNISSVLNREDNVLRSTINMY